MRKEPAVPVIMVCVVFLFVGGAPGVEGAEFDLSTQVSGPSAAGPGTTANITVSYHNAGPDSATNAWVNGWIPSGVPARLIDLTQNQIDALLASVVPDALGNTAYLFADIDHCEHLLFQVQQDVGPSPTGQPIVGLGPGMTGSVSFDVAIPMDPPDLAGLIIDAPPGLAKEYKPTAGFQWLFASEFGSYSVSTCDPTVECTDLSTCFGPRLSYTDPISGNLELVNDGTVDPTWGCEPLIGYTPGNIAVIERGACEFGVKAMGRDADDFEKRVTDIILAHAQRYAGTRNSVNRSGGGKFIAVTVTIEAQSKDQLENIYRDLSDCEQVLVSL